MCAGANVGAGVGDAGAVGFVGVVALCVGAGVGVGVVVG